MKYILSFIALLVCGLVMAQQTKPHPAPHPTPHPHVTPPNGFLKHPHNIVNPSNPHFNQAGVVKNSWGYSYKGHNWNFWKGHKFFSQYGCNCNYNPYAHCWYYWCNPDACWYPVSYCPYSVYSWEDSPCDDTPDSDPIDE
jgi:hypothetical protein